MTVYTMTVGKNECWHWENKNHKKQKLSNLGPFEIQAKEKTVRDVFSPVREIIM